MGTTKASLDTKTIKELKDYSFEIPSFQRGFRWRRHEVELLLEDFWSWYNERYKRSDDDFYCLQTVIVTPQEGEGSNDQEYVVIDGQQRLTTIHMILQYLYHDEPRVELDVFDINYETRESEDFLIKITDEEYRDSMKEENIDFYYMCKAFNKIQSWFSGEMSKISGFRQGFEENVKVIWYEPEGTNSRDEPEGTNSRDIFSQINMGEVRLNNAELVKALFLRKDNFRKNSDKTESEILNRHAELRQLEIAKKWDEIEYGLREDKLWFFLQDPEGEEYDNRIGYIFDLWARQEDKDYFEELEGREYRTFHIFNDALDEDESSKGKKVRKIWEGYEGDDEETTSIKDYYRTFREWYDESEYYHQIGYLIEVEGQKSKKENIQKNIRKKIQEILKKYNEKTKTDFEEFLKSQIKEETFNRENGEEGDLETHIDELEYSSDSKEMKRILLLFNIAWILNSSSEVRFRFDQFKKQDWELEHIHAVNSELPENPPEQKDWLNRAKEVLEKYDEDTQEGLDEDKKEELIEEIDSFEADDKSEGLEFKDLAEKIIDSYGSIEEGNEDNISNLTLLPGKINKDLSNGLFPYKRGKVKERDESGDFIPICTKNVYLKYYSEQIKNPTFWAEDDREAYQNELIRTVEQFFDGDDGEREES